MFDDHEGWRHTCFLTDQTSPHIAQLELRHRQQGRAETVIRDVKACGLDTMPSNDVVNNETWAILAATALNLCSWTRQLTLHDTGLARATAKTLRYSSAPPAATTTAAASTSASTGPTPPPSPQPSTNSTPASRHPA